MFSSCSMSSNIMGDLAMDKLFNLSLYPSFITVPASWVVVCIKKDDPLVMRLVAQYLAHSNSLMITSN